MRPSILRWLCLIFCTLLYGYGATAFALPPAILSPSLQNSLQQTRDAHHRALLAGDATPLTAGCTDNTRLMTESSSTVIGAASINAYYQAFFARFVVREDTRSEVQCYDFGPRLAEAGRFSLTLAPRAGGEPIQFQGKYLEIWDRTGDRLNGLVVSAWNYDSRPGDGDVLRFPTVPSVRTAFQSRTPIDSDISLELAARCMLIGRIVTEHDAKVWARLYTDDALLLVNNAPIARGRPAIDTYLVQHCRELPIFEHLDIRNDRIEEVGAYIYEYASHVAIWRNGDSSGAATGKDLRIWRREPSHILKMVLQIGAYD